jgi:hypothetical protein
MKERRGGGITRSMNLARLIPIAIGIGKRKNEKGFRSESPSTGLSIILG